MVIIDVGISSGALRSALRSGFTVVAEPDLIMQQIHERRLKDPGQERD
jgi:hypothetical protein